MIGHVTQILSSHWSHHHHMIITVISLGYIPGAGQELAGDKFQRSITEGDLEFLKFLSYDELTSRYFSSTSLLDVQKNVLKYTYENKSWFISLYFRMAGLDSEMEKEIDDLRRRYQSKRQPILDAMDQKRKRQQNF